jgi:acyl-coenzyme A thioesterase PaaI-like protein
MKLDELIKRASTSTFYKWVLERACSWKVPFNAPHKFRILETGEGYTKISLPYRRSNLNHVNGIHACALATLCEFTIGLTLLGKISLQKYRIILKNIRVNYHYQARLPVYAEFKIDDGFVKNEIITALVNQDAVFHEFEIRVFDTSQNHICTGLINWQIKKWAKVRNI